MAKRQAPARGRTIREREDADDVVVAGLFEVSNWAKKNRQALVLTGIFVALALGGIIYYANYRTNLNQLAVAELERVQQFLGGGNLAEAETQLTRYVERFGDTRHAGEARLILAQIHLAQGKPEQAIVALEEASRSARDPLRAQNGNLLARAYEQQGRWENAEREYMAVADAAPLDFQRREALADAARVRSRLGNHAGAADLYRQILEDLEKNDARRGLFEMRLAEEEQRING